MRFQNLDEWLGWQARLHPSVIELGLERIVAVWQRLYPKPYPSIVITVAGTNGKGSCVAMLDAILRAAGYRTGCYTSPHLLRYNERIRVDGEEVSDERICQAFERVDQARSLSENREPTAEKAFWPDISLTYFEFGTLAALDIFAHDSLDAVVLEVGLGGRLDAVNIIDPDVALITSVDLDHTDWLGDDLEQIALEKAGILRAKRPAVFGGTKPPLSLLLRAEELDVPLAVAGEGFSFDEKGQVWDWHTGEHSLRDLPRPSLAGPFQLQNAAAVLKTLDLLTDRLPVVRDAVCMGLTNLSLAGRFQIVPGPVNLILDVAHNPAAARVLADALEQTPCSGRTLAVFSMLSDKDIGAVAEILAPRVDGWYIGTLEDTRALRAEDILQRMNLPGAGCKARLFESLSEAFNTAKAEACEGDRLLVFGSFLTVASVLELIEEPVPVMKIHP